MPLPPASKSASSPCPPARVFYSNLIDASMNSASPLVSILIPSYNYGDYLPCTIESVLGQTYRNLELIIVDNASTDNSLEIARRYASDPRVTILEIKENKGPVPAWNLGFQHVRGEWFAMLPADDYFEPDKLEKQIAYICLHPEVTMLATFVRQVDETGRPSYDSWIEPVVNIQPDYNDPSIWDWEHHFCIPTAIYRMDICRRVGQLSTGLHSVVDIEFHVRLMREGAVAHVLPEQLTNYRWHTRNQSGKNNQKTAQQWVYYQITQLLPFASENGYLDTNFFRRSMRKFFSQFYFLDSTVNEAAAFLSCFHSWRDFGIRLADFDAFDAFVVKYRPEREPQSLFFVTLAEIIMQHHCLMQDSSIKIKHKSCPKHRQNESKGKFKKLENLSECIKTDIPELYLTKREKDRTIYMGWFKITRPSLPLGRKLKQAVKSLIRKK